MLCYLYYMLLISQLNIDNDYYSVVGIDEPSICEDVEGINLQDDTADDNKEGHKTVNDHILMLGSIVSLKVCYKGVVYICTVTQCNL